jgi:sec-independent protein translocase protein TatA
MPSSLGPAEILVILVVALIVLGPKRLPEAGRQVGKAIAEVRKWSQGVQEEIRSAVDFDPDGVRPSYSTPPPDREPAPTVEPASADPPGPPAGGPPRP